jgi:predicted nuclease of predicted toxin-antitoxin system
MPLPLYMDVHVPAAISAGLRRRGLDVLSSQDDGTSRFPDDRLLERACAVGRLLFSQDDDMLRLASEWQRIKRPFSGILYAHQLNAGIGALVSDLELVLSCCTADELANRVTYLQLK